MKLANLFSSKKTITETIEQIHHEFETAADRLLEEAKGIINNKEKLIEKANRLKAVGFHSECAEIKQASGLIKLQSTVDAIMYYQTYYPSNKFITEDQIKVICEKYGLLFTEIGYYKGFVPEKNLLHIEKFVLRDEDYIRHIIDPRQQYYHRQMQQASDLSRLMGMRPRYESNSIEPKEFPQPYEHKSKPSYKICAPEKDLDMRYLRKSGHLAVPDPVVVQPVKDGYLIVTAWGDEASDEIVVNQKQN